MSVPALQSSVLQSILAAGIQAPSGDNIQPWAFAVEGNKVALHVVRNPASSLFDFRGNATLLSAGAVLENMRQAAASQGLRMAILEAPAAVGSDLAAVVEFTPGLQPAGEGQLAEAIPLRCVNRRMYRRAPLPPGLVETLARAIAEFPVRLQSVTDRAGLRKLAGAAAHLEHVRCNERTIHIELHAMLRWTPAEVARTRDGFPVDNLMVGFTGKLFLRLTRRWNIMHALNRLGLWRLPADIVRRAFVRSSGALLLTLPDSTPERFLAGGQALERLWLMLTQQGLAVQPMAALPLLANRWFSDGEHSFAPENHDALRKGLAIFQECFPEANLPTGGSAMLLRIGYADPIPVRTLRRSPDQLLRS